LYRWTKKRMLNDRIVYRYGDFRLCLKISNSMHGPKKTSRLRLAVGCLTYKRWESNLQEFLVQIKLLLDTQIVLENEDYCFSLHQPRTILWLTLFLHKSEKQVFVFHEIHTESNNDFQGKNQWNGLFLSTWLIRYSVSALQKGLLHNIYLNSKIRTDKFRKFCQSFL